MSGLLLHTDADTGIATVTLNRPQVHNAFDEALIAELHQTLNDLGANPQVRVVVLAAAGRSFSAGADLNWMRRAATWDEARNRADARALADLLHCLYHLPMPTVAAVQGSAIGGGVGLVCCCDIAIASAGARFAFSEVLLGLIPSVIAPYALRAIGPRAARRWFAGGERFDAAEAQRIGLVHRVVGEEDGDLMTAVGEQCKALLKGGPQAQREAKALLTMLEGMAPGEDTMELTATRIAQRRASAEGRAGIEAFLAGKTPPWLQ